MNYRFEQPLYLWLLCLIPIGIFAYLLYCKQQKAMRAKIGQHKTIAPLLRTSTNGRQHLKIVFFFAALFFGIVGLANLQQKDALQNVERKGIDIIFTLDVSRSMLATDMEPTRLMRAKQFIKSCMNEMSNNRIGLVVFAGKAYRQVPLTVDFNAAKLILDNAHPDMIPSQGTVLADAIELANESFSTKDMKYKAIVLISDGEDHDENAVEAAKEVHKTGTIVYTVGIGSPNGTVIKDPKTNTAKLDENGQEIITKLNETTLKTIAKDTYGEYFLLNNINSTADKLITALDGMEKNNLGASAFTSYKSYFIYCFAAASLLLLVSLFIPLYQKN